MTKRVRLHVCCCHALLCVPAPRSRALRAVAAPLPALTAPWLLHLLLHPPAAPSFCPALQADVRYVVHWDPPASAEGLYQEAGR